MGTGLDRDRERLAYVGCGLNRQVSGDPDDAAITVGFDAELKRTVRTHRLSSLSGGKECHRNVVEWQNAAGGTKLNGLVRHTEDDACRFILREGGGTRLFQ